MADIDARSRWARVRRDYDYHARNKHFLLGYLVSTDLGVRRRDHLRGLLEGARVSIRLRSPAFHDLLAERRYKTLHETGTSGGLSDATLRRALETDVWSLDEAPLSAYPTYGYVSSLSDVQPPLLGQLRAAYGGIRLILCREVEARTTITFEDSLFNLQYGMVIPSPLTRVQAACYPAARDPFQRESVDIGTHANDYVEAQVIGGVTLDDIAYVQFNHPPAAALLDRLEELGIPCGRAAPTDDRNLRC